MLGVVLFEFTVCVIRCLDVCSLAYSATYSTSLLLHVLVKYTYGPSYCWLDVVITYNGNVFSDGSCAVAAR